MSPAPAGVPGPVEVMRRAGGENFPVASRLFPAGMRPHLLAVYGFARLADDLGDKAPGDRLALLDWLDGELRAAAAGWAEHPILRRLGLTIRAFDLPLVPFERLVEANRRDQTVRRYERFGDLLDYCALSANPVGELVLRIAGAATPGRLALSDATCSGLQLVELWQDLGEDVARGRVYLPQEDLRRFGYAEDDLRRGVRDERFAALMAVQAERARALLARGRALAGTLPGRVGLAVRLFTAGGLAALSDLERRGFDTLRVSARASRPRRAGAALAELLRPAPSSVGAP